MKIFLSASAKINLTLDVICRRQDGYHRVEMIMQETELSDDVHIAVSDGPGGISVRCSHPDVPDGENNIAYRAAKLIKETFHIGKQVEIYIEKRIPVAAGLAGGSADAAAVIKGLNLLWELGMDEAAMMNMGAVLGADVPFCIRGGTCLAGGIGEVLTPITSKAVLDLLLVKPEVMVSTAWAYNNLNLNAIRKRPDNSSMIDALERGDIREIAGGLINVLENVTIPRYPEIEQIKGEMMDAGALGAAMSGSGPTVFGIFGSVSEADAASRIFRRKYKDVIATKTKLRGKQGMC
ncbi:MAG: 4-diphosphocytidyl-2-C-methyl-D-erythritol kinase [Firmicutes bacterium]|nr:4-diphosphocytidyl-2-C-methyl-D-erythritol kinase [Bacillota bacterium]